MAAIKTGGVLSGAIVTVNGAGVPTTPTVGPVGTLYVNGVASAAAVVFTGANPYKWTVTLPTINAGDILQMYVTATIAGSAVASFGWWGMVEDSTLWGVIRPG